MKLQEFPEYLPIEAIEGIIRILNILIKNLKSHDFFVESENIADYQETLENLKRDVIDCFNLYDIWQQEPKAVNFKDALAKMNGCLIEAKILLKKCNLAIIH